MTEWGERLERLSRQAARQWHRHPDHEELLQEARIVAWQHAEEPDPHIVQSCRLRLIDVIRSRDGRTGPGRTARPQLVPLNAGVMAAGRYDGTTHLEALAPSECWGVPGRLGVLADALAAGYPKQAIAQALQVHPSRVSQLIAELRELVP